MAAIVPQTKGATVRDLSLPTVHDLVMPGNGFLDFDGHVRTFVDMQHRTVTATREVAASIRPGMSEAQIAEIYAGALAARGLVEHWYPILVYVGPSTALPISRRFHLPSPDVVVQYDDIVMLDCTPLDGTVWSNWAETYCIGNDSFIAELIADTQSVAGAVYEHASRSRTVGEIFDFAVDLIAASNLTSLDPRNDVGHDIFQVPMGQTVDQTPLDERLFLSDEHRNRPLAGIISIEPQLGRVNPRTGAMMSAKIQRVLAYGLAVNQEGTAVR